MATKLVEFGNNIRVIDGERLTMFAIPLQTRMTIVRLESGRLWLHSPVSPTEKMFELVNEIGEVSYLVAPDNLHHASLGQWKRTYPEARLFGVERLREKRADLTFADVLSDGPQAEWGSEIDQLYFRGSKFLQEVVFFHRPSRTLILTDLIQNHDPGQDTLFWRKIKDFNGVLSPPGGVPEDLQMTICDKEEAMRSVRSMLAWNFDRLIISHGLCIEDDARQYVSNRFSWLNS